MRNSYLEALAWLGVGGAHPGGKTLTKHMLNKEKINQSMTILDAGCGTGQTSAYIADKYNCQVIALDNNKMMIDKAKHTLNNYQTHVELRLGSTEDLPFKNSSFDMVISESVIAFTNVDKTVSEFKRVLKPNGRLLAIEMVKEEKDVIDSELNHWKDFYGVDQLLTVKEWRDIFRQNNFKNVNVQKHHIKTSVWNVDDSPEFNISSTDLFDVIMEHQFLTERYKDYIGFRLFRCY